MKVRILGCGPSYGVPSLNRGYGSCNPDNPKNFRLRSSVLIQSDQSNILIDSGPEVRIQLLKAGSPHLDAVLYTHEHYDHMGGADDLRSELNEQMRILPVYLTRQASHHFKNMLDYLFDLKGDENPVFDIHLIQPYRPIKIKDISVLPIPQRHGAGMSVGFRIGDFAYSTDVSDMDERAFDALRGIKVWILGVVTPVPNNKHINLDQALQWIEKVKPERVYLTHMGTRMDYDQLCQTLPDYIRPVYDEMEIEL